MNKTLQQIKDEYAIEEHCLESFDQLIRVDEITDRDVDHIAIRYAQDQNKELVEMLRECASVLRWTLDNATPDSDWTTFTNSITNAMVASEELINSSTQIS